jgi:hypothetical protein
MTDFSNRWPEWAHRLLRSGKAAQDNHKPHMLILYDKDTVLGLLAGGWTLSVSTSSNAMWLEDERGQETPFKCGWPVKHWLERQGFIDKTKELPFVSKWTATKAESDREKSKEQSAKLTTIHALPAARLDNVKHKKQDKETLPEWWPKTFAVNRTKDLKFISGTGFVIHGIVFADGKTVIYWTSSRAVATFDSFKAFEDTHLRGGNHGGAEVFWFDEKRRAPVELLGSVKLKKQRAETEKTKMKACFYCSQGYVTKTVGRKAWRNCCKDKLCRKKLAVDTKTKRELAEAGIPTEGL